MNYTEWKGMQKQAGGFATGAAGIMGLGDAFKGPAIWILAAAAGLGGGAGYLAAKLNAHDKQDIETIQKEYENQRLSADLGYLSAKTKEEQTALANKQQPKAMRMFA